MGLYTEMVIKGLLPDVVAYTALIDGHFKDGNTKEAFRLHKEMQEAGLHPNVFTLSCLIDGLCKDGRISDAIKLFLAKTGTDTTGSKTNELDRSLCSPNHVMYTALIQGLCTDGRIFKASKFFSDMRCSGLRPDVFTCIVIIQGHFRAMHLRDVMMLQADILKMGIIPNSSVYRVLAKGYEESGYLKSALRCSEDLSGIGIGCSNLNDL